MSIYDFLKDKASEQLDSLTTKITDESWFNTLIDKLKDEVGKAKLPTPVANASYEAIEKIEQNKENLIGLGKDAFNLFIVQITSGREKEGIETYISSITTADDLITLMNTGTDGVIKAKIELDKRNATAKKLVFDILNTGVRYLVPFLLTLI